MSLPSRKSKGDASEHPFPGLAAAPLRTHRGTTIPGHTLVVYDPESAQGSMGMFTAFAVFRTQAMACCAIGEGVRLTSVTIPISE